MISTWLALSLGIGMGILSGMGVGGGKLLVPVLVCLFAVPQHTAQGISLLALLPIALTAGIIHRRTGAVDARVALWVVVGGMLGAGLGAWTSLYVGHDLLRRIYGGFLIVMALYEMCNREGTQAGR